MDGDGDITRPENMTAFRNFVLESTEKRGLHFLMADGVRLFFFTAEHIYLKACKNQKCTYERVGFTCQKDDITDSCSSWVELRFLV